MKILLLISESWNDIVHPNNNMSNWFKDFEGVEIYTVSGGPQAPVNSCCKNYFQLSDYDMAKALLPWKKAGKIIKLNDYPKAKSDNLLSVTENKVYSKSNKLHSWFFRLARDFIWRFGKYDKKQLREFIESFNPDVIFSQRMGSVKMCRMERIVQSITSAPMVAYTGDNEYFVNAMPKQFLGKVHALWTRRWLDRQIPSYSLYYSMSQEQMKFYSEKYGVKTDFLVKCGDFSSVVPHNTAHTPIKMVYAGKIYAGRWKTLALLVKNMEQFNSEDIRLQLDIYTPDVLTTEQEVALNAPGWSTVHSVVKPEELLEIYKSSDIVIHAESLNKQDASATRFSFSTKIIDCLASGCAVMAICEEHQSGFVYLRENDIAITASSEEELVSVLKNLINNTGQVSCYAEKAVDFGKEHHQRREIQSKFINDFTKVISEKIC